MEPEYTTNKYSYLLECPNLKTGEENEIFSAINKKIDVELNKSRLFNAFFKRIYKEASKIIKLRYHDNFEEAINHVTYYFYRGINTYNLGKGACFYTHIENWVRCATKRCSELRNFPNTEPLQIDEPYGEKYDSNLFAKEKQEVFDYCQDYCSGIDVINEICSTDLIDCIKNAVERNKSLDKKEKQAFLEYYGFGCDDSKRMKTLRQIGGECGVTGQSILNRKSKVESELKKHFKKSDFIT